MSLGTLASKLGHALGDVRVRAVRSLRFKRDHGLATAEQLMAEGGGALVEGLAGWFRADRPESAAVADEHALALLQSIAKESTLAAQRLVSLGALGVLESRLRDASAPEALRQAMEESVRALRRIAPQHSTESDAVSEHVRKWLVRESKAAAAEPARNADADAPAVGSAFFAAKAPAPAPAPATEPQLRFRHAWRFPRVQLARTDEQQVLQLCMALDLDHLPSVREACRQLEWRVLEDFPPQTLLQRPSTAVPSLIELARTPSEIGLDAAAVSALAALFAKLQAALRLHVDLRFRAPPDAAEGNEFLYPPFHGTPSAPLPVQEGQLSESLALSEAAHLVFSAASQMLRSDAKAALLLPLLSDLVPLLFASSPSDECRAERAAQLDGYLRALATALRFHGAEAVASSPLLCGIAELALQLLSAVPPAEARLPSEMCDALEALVRDATLATTQPALLAQVLEELAAARPAAVAEFRRSRAVLASLSRAHALLGSGAPLAADALRACLDSVAFQIELVPQVLRAALAASGGARERRETLLALLSHDVDGVRAASYSGCLQWARELGEAEAEVRVATAFDETVLHHVVARGATDAVGAVADAAVQLLLEISRRAPRAATAALRASLPWLSVLGWQLPPLAGLRALAERESEPADVLLCHARALFLVQPAARAEAAVFASEYLSRARGREARLAWDPAAGASPAWLDPLAEARVHAGAGAGAVAAEFHAQDVQNLLRIFANGEYEPSLRRAAADQLVMLLADARFRPLLRTQQLADAVSTTLRAQPAAEDADDKADEAAPMEAIAAARAGLRVACWRLLSLGLEQPIDPGRPLDAALVEAAFADTLLSDEPLRSAAARALAMMAFAPLAAHSPGLPLRLPRALRGVLSLPMRAAFEDDAAVVSDAESAQRVRALVLRAREVAQRGARERPDAAAELLEALARSRSHGEFHANLRALLALWEASDAAERAAVARLPWRRAIERFLSVLPNSEDDDDLFLAAVDLAARLLAAAPPADVASAAAVLRRIVSRAAPAERLGDAAAASAAPWLQTTREDRTAVKRGLYRLLSAAAAAAAARPSSGPQGTPALVSLLRETPLAAELLVDLNPVALHVANAPHLVAVQSAALQALQQLLRVRDLAAALLASAPRLVGALVALLAAPRLPGSFVNKSVVRGSLHCLLAVAEHAAPRRVAGADGEDEQGAAAAGEEKETEEEEEEEAEEASGEQQWRQWLDKDGSVRWCTALFRDRESAVKAAALRLASALAPRLAAHWPAEPLRDAVALARAASESSAAREHAVAFIASVALSPPRRRRAAAADEKAHVGDEPFAAAAEALEEGVATLLRGAAEELVCAPATAPALWLRALVLLRNALATRGAAPLARELLSDGALREAALRCCDLARVRQRCERDLRAFEDAVPGDALSWSRLLCVAPEEAPRPLRAALQRRLWARLERVRLLRSEDAAGEAFPVSVPRAEWEWHWRAVHRPAALLAAAQALDVAAATLSAASDPAAAARRAALIDAVSLVFASLAEDCREGAAAARGEAGAGEDAWALRFGEGELTLLESAFAALAAGLERRPTAEQRALLERLFASRIAAAAAASPARAADACAAASLDAPGAALDFLDRSFARVAAAAVGGLSASGGDGGAAVASASDEKEEADEARGDGKGSARPAMSPQTLAIVGTLLQLRGGGASARLRTRAAQFLVTAMAAFASPQQQSPAASLAPRAAEALVCRALCQSAQAAFDSGEARVRPAAQRQRARVVACLAGLLALSRAAKIIALEECALGRWAVAEAMRVHAHLALERAHGREASQAAAAATLELRELMALLRHLLFAAPALVKEALLASGLAELVLRLWATCTAVEPLRLEFFALVANGAAGHEETRVALALGREAEERRGRGGLAFRLGELCATRDEGWGALGAEAAQAAWQCLGALCMSERVARVVVAQTSVVGSVLRRLDELGAAKERAAPSFARQQMLLRALVCLSFTEAGRRALTQQVFPRYAGVFVDALRAPVNPQAKNRTTMPIKHLVLFLLRNLAFHEPAKSALLANELLLDVLLATLQGGPPRHQTLVASALWALVFDNQRGVLAVKAKMKEALAELHTRLAASGGPAASALGRVLELLSVE